MTKKFYYKNNWLQQLRAFCAIVEEGSIAKAARKYRMTLANVSLQLSALEREIGFSLFESRKRGHFILSDKGRIFYEKASFYLNGMIELYEKDVDKINEENKQILKIACHPMITNLLLPDVVNSLTKEFGDNIIFSIKEENWKSALEDLANCKIDFAIYPMYHDVEKDARFRFQKFWQYVLTAFVHKNNPIANMNSMDIDFHDLHRLIRVGQSSLNDKLSIEGKNMGNIFLSDYGSVFQMIQKVEGIVAMDKRYELIFPKNDNIICKNLSHLANNVNFYLVERQFNELTKFKMRFIELLIENTKKIN